MPRIEASTTRDLCVYFFVPRRHRTRALKVQNPKPWVPLAWVTLRHSLWRIHRETLVHHYVFAHTFNRN